MRKLLITLLIVTVCFSLISYTAAAAPVDTVAESQAEDTSEMQTVQETPLEAAIHTFLLSMVPVIELRGAIPVGVAGGLHPLLSMFIAIIGNLFPIPFLIVFTRRIFDWLKTKRRFKSLVEKLESRAQKKSEVVMKYAWWGLCILVAIPLPGTGAWTGALVAIILNMNLRKSMPAIFVGVLIAAVIVTVLTYGVTAIF